MFHAFCSPIDLAVAQSCIPVSPKRRPVRDIWDAICLRHPRLRQPPLRTPVLGILHRARTQLTPRFASSWADARYAKILGQSARLDQFALMVIAAYLKVCFEIQLPRQSIPPKGQGAIARTATWSSSGA